MREVKGFFKMIKQAGSLKVYRIKIPGAQIQGTIYFLHSTPVPDEIHLKKVDIAHEVQENGR